jgi:hypothetical protein
MDKVQQNNFIMKIKPHSQTLRSHASDICVFFRSTSGYPLLRSLQLFRYISCSQLTQAVTLVLYLGHVGSNIGRGTDYPDLGARGCLQAV